MFFRLTNSLLLLVTLLTCLAGGFAITDKNRITGTLAVGDLNGDGLPDVVVANANESSVTVLLGLSGEKFKKLGKFATGAGPNAIAIGDFNHDGKLDLAVGNSRGATADTVSILLGAGDGHFGPPTNFITGGKFPTHIATADLNRDGRLDLVVANVESDNLSVLLGAGNGAFAPPSILPTGGIVTTESVAIADLNADGILDLVETHGQGNVGVFMGNGDGSFAPQRLFPAFEVSSAVAIADLNHDGIPDLAVADCNWHAQLVILLGNGDGTFQSPKLYYGGLEVFQIAVADINGDGNLDVVTGDYVNYSGQPVWVHLGNGDGTFQEGVGYAALINITGLAITDFNQNGRVDVVISDLWDGGVGVMIGRGDGTFRKLAFFRS